MTITIDLCWYDKNSELIREILIAFFSILCIPIFVYGVLASFNVIDSIFEYADFSLRAFDLFITTFCIAVGFIGSIVACVVIGIFFEEQNEKHQWFVIKHCDSKEAEL